MLDYNMRFSDAQPLAAGDSTNIIDAGEGDLGKSGDHIALEVIVGKGTGAATSDLSITLATGAADDGSDAKPAMTFYVDKDKVTRGGVVYVSFLGIDLKRYHKLTYAGAAGVTGATVTAGYAIHGGQTNMV